MATKRWLPLALCLLPLLGGPVAAQTRGGPPPVPAGPTVAAGTRRPPPAPAYPATAPVPTAVAPTRAATAPPRGPLPAPRADRQALYFGDSLTDLGSYPGVVSAALGLVRVNYDPANPDRGAISGTSLETGTYQAPGVTTYALRVAPYTLDTLVVFYGVNDFYDMDVPGSPHDATTWRAAWRALYAQIDPARVGRVVAVGLPYMTGGGFPPAPWMGTTEGGREELDVVTAQEAAAHGAIYVSLAAMTPAMISPDQVHPNADGQAFIARRIIAALA